MTILQGIMLSWVALFVFFEIFPWPDYQQPKRWQKVVKPLVRRKGNRRA